MIMHTFCRSDDRLVKLFLFSRLLHKSPLTCTYFATFEKKREFRSPLPTQPNFLVFGIFIKKMFKNFTILKHRTCTLKLSIALTGKTVSFTFNLFLHHSYHHKTLSNSHLPFSLVFSCIIFTLSLTFICAGQDNLCIQHTGIYVNESLLPVYTGTFCKLISWSDIDIA